MLIVCTQDMTIRKAADGVANWGTVNKLQNSLTQANATTALQHLLGAVGSNEDICFSAHGNDTEIGDTTSPWGWDAATIAALLHKYAAGGNWNGRVLFHVCCTSVANFSARVAITLGSLGRRGIRCYGYNRAVGSTEGVPAPANLDKNVSLQVTIS